MIFFFFNDTATTEIYTLSLHDALPIFVEPGGAVGVTPHGRIDLGERLGGGEGGPARRPVYADGHDAPDPGGVGGRDHLGLRSEEHTSELQSQSNIVCRLLLEKKKPLDYLHTPNSRDDAEHRAQEEDERSIPADGRTAQNPSTELGRPNRDVPHYRAP